MAALDVSLSAALREDMREKGVDAGLTLSILADYNAGLFDGVRPVRAAGVPAIDGRSVVETAGAALTFASPSSRGPPTGY